MKFPFTRAIIDERKLFVHMDHMRFHSCHFYTELLQMLKYKVEFASRFVHEVEEKEDLRQDWRSWGREEIIVLI